MTRPGAVAIGTMVAATALLTSGVCGCQLLPVTGAAGTGVVAPAGRPAVLAVILDPASARVRAIFSRLVVATARPGEHLIVICAANGATLGSFTAPSAPRMTGPAFPKALPQNTTSFQRATYRTKLAHSRAIARHDLALVLQEQHDELRKWAETSIAAVVRAADRTKAGRGGLRQAVTEAVADISALQQSRLMLADRKVIVIAGDEVMTPPRMRVSLNGFTAAVADIGRATAGPAWQADFLEAGATDAFAFTAVTDSRLPVVVNAGLTGMAGIPITLARIRYRAAQYRLPRSGASSLRHVLRLLTVTYPAATASINGYADSVAVPGGNLKLSWRRAQAVLAWLVDHCVAANRLQAIGHGADDPVAPNGPGGQPLNRRVVLIISPENGA